MQHRFYLSQRVDTTFLYLQSINSTIRKKTTHARNILKKELANLFSVTKLQQIGPYQLQATCKILSEHYKCQFFVFGNSTSTHKINFMYPEQYNDSLIPIYLYQSFNDLTHLIFIKNLKSYFRSNYSICFECKKSFKSYNYRHFCKKRSSCFVCRRFFQSDKTFVHEKLQTEFCDKLLTNETPFMCSICNCTIFSQHCYKGHKQFCNGDGHFGWKCMTGCNRFIYASQNRTSKLIRDTHSCSDRAICRYCFKLKEQNHICKLKEFQAVPFHSRLAFVTIIMTEECHGKPLFSLFFIEEGTGFSERGCFKNHIIADPKLNFKINKDFFSFSYFLKSMKNTDFEKLRQSFKLTQDFQNIQKSLQTSKDSSFNEQFALFLISSPSTTFICHDDTGKIMVIFLLVLYEQLTVRNHSSLVN